MREPIKFTLSSYDMMLLERYFNSNSRYAVPYTREVTSKVRPSGQRSIAYDYSETKTDWTTMIEHSSYRVLEHISIDMSIESYELLQLVIKMREVMAEFLDTDPEKRYEFEKFLTWRGIGGKSRLD